MKNIILTGYRFYATGVFGYTFYENDEKICSISSYVVFSPPATIIGFSREWVSDFEEKKEVKPGTERKIIDKSDGKTVSGIVYLEKDKYQIGESIIVRCEHGQYIFYNDGKVVAKIKRIDNTDEIANRRQIPADLYDRYECEPYFEVLTDEAISKENLMLILSFPMLRFGK